MTREEKIKFIKNLKDGKISADDLQPKRLTVIFSNPVKYQVNEISVTDAEFLAVMQNTSQLGLDVTKDILNFIYPDENDRNH